MTIYITIFLLTILLIWLAENKVKSKKWKISLLILAVMPMLILSAIRYNLGTDYATTYVGGYSVLAQGIDIAWESGFKMIASACLIFTQEPYLLFAVTSIIILSIIFEVIYNKSVNKILSITVFFLGGYFFGSLNLIRQYVALAFVLLGYQFLMSENQIKAYIGFIICAILAFFMHSSSVICLIILLLNKRNLVSIKYVIPLSIVILIFNEKLMFLLQPIIKNTRFQVYLSGEMSHGDLYILPILENFFLYLWMYIVYYYNTKNNIVTDKQGITLLNIQGIAFLFTVFGVVHMQSMRMSIYFCIFQILSVPYFLKIMPYKNIVALLNNKISKSIKEKTAKIIVYASIVLCFSIIFIYTNILNNDNEVLPYQTIFSRIK